MLVRHDSDVLLLRHRRDVGSMRYGSVVRSTRYGSDVGWMRHRRNIRNLVNLLDDVTLYIVHRLVLYAPPLYSESILPTPATTLQN